MDNTPKTPSLIHNLSADQTGQQITYKTFFIFVAVVVITGTLLGYIVSIIKNATSTANLAQKVTMGQAAGIVDKKTFSDHAEGILRAGGIGDEGSFHLERPGGQSQNAYLTSTTVDLSQYLGKKVRVWGQTYQGKQAPWLMDVGLVEVLN